MKPHLWRRTRLGSFLRHLPRIKHLRGTWLHRRFGDRLFGHEMWNPSRSRFAGGVSVGIFFSMIPLPFQMLASAGLAVLTRVNVPAAIASTWLSNPLTMPLFLYLQYELGCWLIGRQAYLMPQTGAGVVDVLKAAPVALLTGALATGLIGAFLAYPLALLGWDLVGRSLERARAARQLAVKRRAQKD